MGFQVVMNPILVRYPYCVSYTVYAILLFTYCISLLLLNLRTIVILCTVAQFMHVLRQRIQLGATESIYLMVDGITPTTR